MEQTRVDMIRRINYLTKEIDGLYHQAALKFKMSDAVSIVLYNIYDMGEDCLLSDIYKNTGISRQTINSAIRKLEADGILYLEPYSGRAKKIVLTEKGRDYVEHTAARIFGAEMAALDSWTEEEIRTYIALIEKDLTCMRREIDKL